MIPQRIQRKRTKGWRKPEGTVYVGRGTAWGNPYRVVPVSRSGPFDILVHDCFCGQSTGKEFAREMATNRFRQAQKMGWHLTPDLEQIRIGLAGKNLMCWCPLSQPCHADVLLELANGDRLPVGTPVLFWPGARVGEGRQSVTRTPIFKMGDGTEVVSVEGYPGGIALTHIQTLPEGATTTTLDPTP